jgi:hypothetical protein
MDARIPTTEARQATIEGVGRSVLGISLALCDRRFCDHLCNLLQMMKDHAMRELRLIVGIAVLFALPGCVDVPSTSTQIDQDIRSQTWMRDQSPPVSPGILPPERLGDQTQVSP